MTQTTTTVSSYAVTAQVSPGNYTRVTDDAILVKVWSTPIAGEDSSIITATPGAGGTILVQFSFDSQVSWRNASATPYSSTFVGGVPPGVTAIRATAIGATATLVVDTPQSFVELTPNELTSVRSLVSGAGTPNTWKLVGDSMLERTFYSVSASVAAVDNGNGTATLTFATAPLSSAVPIQVGDSIRVNNSATPRLNQVNALVTAIDVGSKTVTYTTTGTYSTMVGSDPPFVLIYRIHSPLSCWPYINMLSGGEHVVVSNCTQGGAANAEILQILQADLSTAKFGLFLCGRNDIYARGFSYAQTIASAKTLLDTLRPLVKNLVILTTPPQTYSASYLGIQLQYEAWLKQYGRSIGAIVIDSGACASGTATYRDQSSAQGGPTTGWSPDGTHQGGLSAYAMGKAVASAITNFVAPSITWPVGAASSYTTDPSLRTDAALLTGTGGTVTPNSGAITGTAPDSTLIVVSSGTAAVTTSQIARTVAADGDAVGNNLRLVITNASGTSTVTFRINITTSRFANGDTIRALARVKLSSSGSPGSGAPVGVNGIDLECRALTATSLFGVSNTSSGVSQTLTEGFSAVLATPPQTIRTPQATHGAVSSGYLLLSVNLTGAGGVTLDIAHPHIRAESVSMQTISA